MREEWSSEAAVKKIDVIFRRIVFLCVESDFIQDMLLWRSVRV